MTWEELAKFIMEMPEEERKRPALYRPNECIDGTSEVSGVCKEDNGNWVIE